MSALLKQLIPCSITLETYKVKKGHWILIKS